MSVLASVMTPATAKSAHKQNGASADGSEAIDFCCIARVRAGRHGAENGVRRQGKHNGKVELMPEGQVESLSAETSVADTELSKSRVKQANRRRLP